MDNRFNFYAVYFELWPVNEKAKKGIVQLELELDCDIIMHLL